MHCFYKISVCTCSHACFIFIKTLWVKYRKGTRTDLAHRKVQIQSAWLLDRSFSVCPNCPNYQPCRSEGKSNQSGDKLFALYTHEYYTVHYTHMNITQYIIHTWILHSTLYTHAYYTVQMKNVLFQYIPPQTKLSVHAALICSTYTDRKKSWVWRRLIHCLFHPFKHFFLPHFSLFYLGLHPSTVFDLPGPASKHCSWFT